MLIELRAIPFVELDPHYNYEKKIKAKEIMTKDVITFKEVEKLSVILKILESTTHNGFPVVTNEKNLFNGVILRNHLVVLIKKAN